MESGINIIKKQIWEIDLDSAQNAFSLQNEWGQFSQTEISPVLDQVCNELVNGETIVKIDKIELDLGAVSFTNMEKELPGIVRQAFRESLAHLLTKSSLTSDENVTIVSSTHSDLDIIDHFLSTGIIPWWASKLKQINLEDTFKQTLSAEKQKSRKLLTAGIQLPDFRKRLVNQFSPELLFSLVEILEPTWVKSIQTLFKVLQKELHDQGSLSTEFDNDSFLWFNIFSYIAENHGKLNEGKLTRYVREAISGKLSEDIVKSKGEKSVIKSDSISTLSKFELIKTFLETGILIGGDGDSVKTDLDNIFKELLAEPNDKIKKFLIEGIKSEKFRTRLTGQFSSELLFMIIDIVWPAFQKTVQSFFIELPVKKISELESKQYTYLWDLVFVFISEKQGKADVDEFRNYVHHGFKQKWPKEVFKTKLYDVQLKPDSLMLLKFELIKTFLDTGILPSDDMFSGNINLDELFKKLSDEQKTMLGSFLRGNIKLKKFRNRIVNHFPPETILLMVKAIDPGQFSTISETWTEFKTLLKFRSRLINNPELEAFLSHQILDFLAKSPLQFTKKELFYYLLKSLNNKWPGIITKRRSAPAGLEIEKLSGSKKLAAIIHYMNTGSLPWWASSWKSEDLPGIFMELLKTPSKETLKFLKQGINYQLFRKRLTYKFSEDTVFSIIRVLEPVHGKLILKTILELVEVFIAGKRKELSSIFTTSFIQTHFLTWHEDSSRPFDIQTWLADLVQSLSRKLDFSNKRTLEWLLEKDPKAIPEKQRVPYSVYSLLEEILVEVSDGEKDIPTQSELNKLQDDGKTIPESQKDELTEIPDKKMDIEIDDYYIDNAGMVLLWPYLAKFFEHLKLIENNQFIDKDRIFKAVHLLQFLVTGKQDQPEYHFPLNKVMCGLDIEEPIPRKLKLKKTEIKACEELLTEVVKNWEALKNTSVDGFREAFLKREGKLTRKDNDWVLKIEQKAYDILLEKLPWSINIVKLSWMPGIMHVEW